MANQIATLATKVVEHNMQTMTSLQIAELTGKQHSHIMEAIRTMEPAWHKVSQSNFRLASYIDKQGKERPCYYLTKTECLYIATKFNDEARAKLVLRWEELETQQLSARQMTPANPQLAYVQTQLYLADALVDRLRLNDASRLGMYQSIAEPYNLALPQYVQSKGVLKSATELLKENGYSISILKFNQLLEEHGYVETLCRTIQGGKVRKFKNVTDKGKQYGENEVNPKNQKETQPHWYADSFTELYGIVTA